MRAFKTKPIVLGLGVATAAVVALVLLAPGAAANPEASLQNVRGPTGVLFPETDVGQLTGEYKYVMPTVAHGGLAAQKQSVTVSFDFTCPSYVVISGPRSILMTLDPTPQGGGEAVQPFSFNVQVTRDAPGLRSISCEVRADATAVQEQAQAGRPETARSEWTVQADYYSLLQAQVSSKFKQAGPQKQVPFEVELTNFGNARTQVNFQMGERPSGERWQPILPEPMILDTPNAPGEGRTSGTAVFTVATPFKNGWNNEQGAFQLIMKPVAADNADKVGNEVHANMLVQVRGVYVPTVEPFLMLAAIVGTAFVVRLRGRE